MSDNTAHALLRQALVHIEKTEDVHDGGQSLSNSIRAYLDKVTPSDPNLVSLADAWSVGLQRHLLQAMTSLQEAKYYARMPGTMDEGTAYRLGEQMMRAQRAIHRIQDLANALSADPARMFPPLGTTVVIGKALDASKSDLMPQEGTHGVVIGYDFASEGSVVVVPSHDTWDNRGNPLRFCAANPYRYKLNAEEFSISGHALLVGVGECTQRQFTPTHMGPHAGRELVPSMVLETETGFWRLLEHDGVVELDQVLDNLETAGLVAIEQPMQGLGR